jgi:serine/threonine protein kinase
MQPGGERPDGFSAGDGSLMAGVIPKITDFGLAKLVAGDDGAHTQSGLILGTPSYMAPEQASARHGEIGPEADIYSLGAVFYEMLVGHPPFRADSAADLLDQVMRHGPVPPGKAEATRGSRSRDGLLEMPGKGVQESLPERAISGRRSAPVLEQSADCGPDDQSAGSSMAMVPPESPTCDDGRGDRAAPRRRRRGGLRRGLVP